MDRSLDRFFQDAANRSAVGHALPDGATVRFEIDDHEEGGVWSLRRIGERIDVVAPPHPRPDCHLSCSFADFMELTDGRLDPKEGLISGRLRVSGDVGIVLQLRRAYLGTLG